MADSDVQVRFGAETSAVTAGGGEVKGVLAGIQEAVAALGNAFKAMGGAAVQGLGAAAGAGKEAAVAVKETAVAASEAKESMIGFGKALIAAFAVKEVADFAKNMAETAEQVAHTATTFGLTTGAVQQLKALAAGAGVPFEALTTAMQRSDRALTTAREGSKQAGEAFKTLGINIHEPIGQVDLIQRELAGLAKVQDVPTRIGLAMQLFGRNIQNIAPLIGLTKAQIDEINQSMTTYGVVNDQAEQKGLALADAFNTNKIAMQGLGNVMMEALAPVLTQIVQGLSGMIAGFIQSYNSGGLARTMMEVLSGSIKTVAIVVVGLGGAFIAAFDFVKAAILSAQDAWQGFVDGFEGNAKTAMDAAVALGKVIYDELTHAVIQGANDMRTGWAQIQRDAAATAQAVAHDAQVMQAAFGKAGGTEGVGALNASLKEIQSLMGSGGGLPALPSGGGGGGLLSDLVNGKGGKGGTDAVQAAMSAFTDQWQHMADVAVAITGNANLDLTQQEVDFWSKKLAAAKQGSDLWYAIIEKLNPMVVGLQKAQADEILKIVEDQIKQEEALQKEHTAAYKTELDAEVKAVIDANNEEVLAYKKAAEQSQQALARTTQAIQPMVSAFTSGIEKMAEGTQSFIQTVRNLGQALLDSILQAVDRGVTFWLAGEIRKTVATVAGSAQRTAAQNAAAAEGRAADEQQVLQDAKVVYGNVFKWASPFLGPFAVAPAAAAAALVVGFQAAEGFDIGNFAPITQLHPQEMVLPARIANPMRDAISAGSFGGGGDGSGGGDTHHHYHLSPTINAIDGSSVRQFFSTHGGAMMDELHSRARNATMPKWANAAR